MAPNIKLTYFGLKGRAEISRLLLHATETPFDDVRVSHAEWPALKPKTLFGSLPYLEYDGQLIGQSETIHRFLAKKTGLYGRNDLEEAQISQVVDHLYDVFRQLVPLRWNKDLTSKQAAAEKLISEALPKNLEMAEKLLTMTQGKYFVGNSLSLADIVLFYLLDCVMDPDDAGFAELTGTTVNRRLNILDDFHKLKTNYELVKSLPGMKKYLAARPKTPY